MGLVSLPVSRGTATGVDPSLHDRLVESEGVVYQPGDPAAHKFPGRTVANSPDLSANAVTDVMFADAGNTRILALTGAQVWASVTTDSTVYGLIWTFPSSGLQPDITSLDDLAYVVSGHESTATSPFGAFRLSGVIVGATDRLGLSPSIANPGAALIAGTLTGAYYYWTTEYDSSILVESAHDDSLTGTLANPGGQGVRITKPTTVNASADKWRIYRSIASGSKPIGWLVAEVAIGTTTYDDTGLTDANLVLNDPYRIVSPNGIPESMDVDPQPLGLSSITTFEGSLVGVVTDGGIAWTPAGEPHSWPVSYRINMPTELGGHETCVRKCGESVYCATKHELFRINYLPDESDNVFSPDIAIEHVANYGTPSNRGMCRFTAWGGSPVLFVGSLQGPMLCTGRFVDRAVRNIDWSGTVDLSLLSFCKAVDNPDEFCVDFFFRDDPDDATSWKLLKFYYDSDRTEVSRSGPLPDMAWTGPHEVPGPGCYAVGASGPKKFTAGHAGAVGKVYLEGQGTSDAALLVDASGTINFRLRTQRPYPAGIGGEARADRLFVHSKEASDQDYDCTFTAYRENGDSTAYGNLVIDPQGSGLQSVGLNASHVSFDVRITADGVDGMAPINNISVNVEETKKGMKTQVVTIAGG